MGELNSLELAAISILIAPIAVNMLLPAQPNRRSRRYGHAAAERAVLPAIKLATGFEHSRFASLVCIVARVLPRMLITATGTASAALASRALYSSRATAAQTWP